MSEQPEQEDSQNFKKLREKAEALQAENTQLRKVAAENMVQVAGFDPNHRLTSLVLDQFLAQQDVELKPAAFKTFAEEYQLPTTTVTTGPDSSEAFDALQAGADQLRQNTYQPTATPTLQEEIARAESSGDFNASLALKAQQVRAAILNSR